MNRTPEENRDAQQRDDPQRSGDPQQGDAPVAAGETADEAMAGIRPRASRDLRKEHVHVLRMLDILDAVRGLLASGDPPPLEDWEDIVNFLRVFVDRCHHGKEERALFPAMMLVADDRLKSLMEELLVEHVESRGLVAALAAAAGTDPVLPGNPKAGRPGGEDFLDTAAADRAIAGYVALVRPHVMREEEQLYPAADGLLAGELQESLQGEYDRIAEETIGQVPGAFEKTIVRLEERYLPRQEA